MKLSAVMYQDLLLVNAKLGHISMLPARSKGPFIRAMVIPARQCLQIEPMQFNTREWRNNGAAIIQNVNRGKPKDVIGDGGEWRVVLNFKSYVRGNFIFSCLVRRCKYENKGSLMVLVCTHVFKSGLVKVCCLHLLFLIFACHILKIWSH